MKMTSDPPPLGPTVKRRTVIWLGSMGAAGSLLALTGCTKSITSYSINFTHLCASDSLEVNWVANEPVLIRIVAAGNVVRESPVTKTGPFRTTLSPGAYSILAIVKGTTERSDAVTVASRELPTVIQIRLVGTCEEPYSSRVRSADSGATFSPNVIVDRVTLSPGNPSVDSRPIRLSHESINDVALTPGASTDLFAGTHPNTPWQADVQSYVGDATYCVYNPGDPLGGDPGPEKIPPPTQNLLATLICKS